MLTFQLKNTWKWISILVGNEIDQFFFLQKLKKPSFPKQLIA